jgi:hypothetical protein
LDKDKERDNMENSYILDLGKLKSDLLEALEKSGIYGDKAEEAVNAAIAVIVVGEDAC